MVCECGCGQAVKGGQRFILGHNRRERLVIWEDEFEDLEGLARKIKKRMME